MRLSRLLVIAGLFLTATALSAQTTETVTATIPAVRAPEEVIDSLRLRDAPLDLVIDRLEAWTGRIVLRPQALPATAITLNIPRPIPKSEAIRALISALALNNIGVVEMGDKYLKIIELANKTRSEAPEFITGSVMDLPASGKVASKVFELTNLKAQDFVPQLNTLLNVQLGGAILFNNTNAFLVTDSISNLQRVEQLLLALDVPASTDFKPRFYTLRFAKASDLASRVKLMLQGPNQLALGNSLSLSADDRTNQLVLIADPRQYAFFDELITKLDVKADPNTRNEVVYLKHATAKDVATLLSTVVTGQTAIAAKTNGSTRPNAQANAGNANTAKPAATGNNNAAPVISNANALASSIASDSATQFSGLLTVAPDDRSNAIVVSGTVDDIRLITELIDKLDIILAQVRIEIVVAEVTLSDSATSGIDALGLNVSGNKLRGFSGSGSGTTVTNGTIAYNSNGSVDLAATIGFTTTPRKGTTSILSVPTITTTHNKEASIFVGETRPTITGITTSTASSATTAGTTSSTVSQQEIGITITVTPLIGNDGSVQLDLKQEISDTGDPVTIDGNVQNVINKRKTQSFITAKSGDILVLGGLQKKATTRSTSRLGPIPFIGDLFGTRTHEDRRTELIFFLRPTILTNTTVDNAPALNQVDQLPNKDAVLKQLDPNYVPPTKRATDKTPAPKRSR
ncbi:MAG: secretin N-terminal domain-containing protein [Opitutaceae bacterium]|jgi:general secretion pathway protein D